MKVTIDGIRLDTDNATFHTTLYYVDDRSNAHTGDVYCSSKGQWYVYTPSQWANQHSWTLSTPEEILSDYDGYLTQENKEALAEAADLGWD